jgi:hypothetical protein
MDFSRQQISTFSFPSTLPSCVWIFYSADADIISAVTLQSWIRILSSLLISTFSAVTLLSWIWISLSSQQFQHSVSFHITIMSMDFLLRRCWCWYFSAVTLQSWIWILSRLLISTFSAVTVMSWIWILVNKFQHSVYFQISIMSMDFLLSWCWK